MLHLGILARVSASQYKGETLKNGLIPTYLPEFDITEVSTNFCYTACTLYSVGS